MATVYKLLPAPYAFCIELIERFYQAEARRYRRFRAVLTLQRMTRGYLIRKHVAWLSKNALTIQCAFRVHQARKAFRAALRAAVRKKHDRYYARAATIIQACWRGYHSRKTKFCYNDYRRWLRTVTERGDRRAAEAAEFAIRSRADDLRILEEEARQWLAFVIFKLHHLLRTYNVSGVYSTKATTELSEFEKLLKSIQYTEYMKRLRRKYEEFVKKHKPQFSNKRLFPIIGEGADYWYLSLPEMYELTTPMPTHEQKRHIATHHGKIHKEPFLWRKVRPPTFIEGRGPFTPPRSVRQRLPPPAPAPTPNPATAAGDATATAEMRKDPRFCLYVKYYKPRPDVIDYVDYHINVLLRRKCEIQNVTLPSKTSNKSSPTNKPATT